MRENLVNAPPMSPCSIVLYIHVLLKLIKTLLHSHLADSNLELLMKVAIEGPPLKDIDFIGILNFDLNNYK